MIDSGELIMLPVLVAYDVAFYDRTVSLFERFGEQPVRWSETLHPRWVASVAGLGAMVLDAVGFGSIYRWIGITLFFGSLSFAIYLGWRGRRSR